MSAQEAILSRLKKTGHRLTPQRLMILAVIDEEGGHVGPDRVFERVKEQYPYIDIATVYRTLHLLKKLHLISEIDRGGASRYEINEPGTRHHHMVCEECGNTFDLPPKYLDALRQTLLNEVGFEPHTEHFTISGLCSECRSTDKHRVTNPADNEGHHVG
ncbi:MAG: Fur family transcriptional regulator, ferric uptake regulator [Chloroflexi bacterium]|jgi:Fur family ferric uptake transcriptional regulator|nr:MAG: Fur family transcriptional regulator, ferric uptake regulator [Chloroflexota bacterium]